MIQGRGLRNRVFGWWLIVLLTGYGLTATFAGLFSGPGAFRFDWDAALLFGLLPSVVIWHSCLASPGRQATTDARLAAS